MCGGALAVDRDLPVSVAFAYEWDTGVFSFFVSFRVFRVADRTVCSAVGFGDTRRRYTPAGRVIVCVYLLFRRATVYAITARAR